MKLKLSIRATRIDSRDNNLWNTKMRLILTGARWLAAENGSLDVDQVEHWGLSIRNESERRVNAPGTRLVPCIFHRDPIISRGSRNFQVPCYYTFHW